MRILSFLVAICVASAAIGTPNAEHPHGSEAIAVRATPADQDIATLLRAYNPFIQNHFYTTDDVEMDVMETVYQYQPEPSPGRLYINPSAAEGLIPLYRAYNPSIIDCLLTTNKTEVDEAVSKEGYLPEGITGYVFPQHSDQVKNIPLFRAWNPNVTDHFYTSDIYELSKKLQSEGYRMQGVTGFILPRPGP